jgi:hypothetical protein
MQRLTVAILVSMILALVGSGCISKYAYEEYDHVALRAAWLEVTEATPNHVQIVVRTEYDRSRSKRTDFGFNPRLDGCDSVRVSRRTKSGPEFLTVGTRYAVEEADIEANRLFDDEEGVVTSSQINEVDSECSVTLLISSRVRNLSIGVENPERLLGEATIRSPKDVVALVILLPHTFALDVVSIPLILPILCLVNMECLGQLITIGLEAVTNSA